MYALNLMPSLDTARERYAVAFKSLVFMQLPWQSERRIFLGALVAGLFSACLLFQAVDDLVDDGLAIDARSYGLLFIAGAACAAAAACICALTRGRSLNAVRSSLRANLCALPGLQSPATLFIMCFAALLTVALSAHVGEPGAATIMERTDLVVSLLTAITLSTAATVVAHLIIRVAPEVVRRIIAFLIRRKICRDLIFSIPAKTIATHSFAAWSPPLFSRPPPLPR